MTAISDLNDKVSALEAELAVNHRLLDELKALVDANAGGSIPTSDVEAITARVDADLQALQAADSSDTPPPAPAPGI